MTDVLAAVCIFSLLAGLFTAAVRVHVKVGETEQRILEEIEGSRREWLKEQKGCSACAEEAP
ncbi:MAG: hypothetical protein IKG46_03285 [Solobacterium sp.]|nr:hypothetical protein [Solobacterium sp.]